MSSNPWLGMTEAGVAANPPTMQAIVDISKSGKCVCGLFQYTREAEARRRRVLPSTTWAPHLPVEVQVMIWKLLQPGPELIAVELYEVTKKDGSLLQFRSDWRPHALLGINRASRTIFLKKHTSIFEPYDMSRTIRFNADKDTILLWKDNHRRCHEPRALFEVTAPLTAPNYTRKQLYQLFYEIKSLALFKPLPDARSISLWRFKPLVNFFKSIEKVTIIQSQEAVFCRARAKLTGILSFQLKAWSQYPPPDEGRELQQWNWTARVVHENCIRGIIRAKYGYKEDDGERRISPESNIMVLPNGM